MNTADIKGIARALNAGIRFLAAGQHADGCWTDFWLPVGTSDAWVTAYVGLALQTANSNSILAAETINTAADCANRAADWLIRNRVPHREWGFNAGVPNDADSTAHVVSLLSRLERSVPEEVLAALKKYLIPQRGYCTFYHLGDWAAPANDVTAACERALFDAGAIDKNELRKQYRDLLMSNQNERGWWRGYWWLTPNYTTALILETKSLAGETTFAAAVSPDLPINNNFDLACAVAVRHLTANPFDDLLKLLLSNQLPDGGWLSAPILRVPPARRDKFQARLLTAGDARRLFVTATAVRVLSRILPQNIAAAGFAESKNADFSLHNSGSMKRAKVGFALDKVVERTALSIGFDAANALRAKRLFAAMTVKSLSCPSPYPAPQLSSLSNGVPIEFSANFGDRREPALRYAVETGDPYLAPFRRAASAVESIAAVAAALGYQKSWRRIEPAFQALVKPELGTTEALRFWVWGGAEQAAATVNKPTQPRLKIYFNLLNNAGGARVRLEAALRNIGIPYGDELNSSLNALAAAGAAPQEIGFAVAETQTACKIYYQINGWQPDLVERLLQNAGLPPDLAKLNPAIPKILTEALSRKMRAGIALRIHPETGAILDLTTAMRFPPALVDARETENRIRRWIIAENCGAANYAAVSEMLLSDFMSVEGAAAPQTLHTLFTRTVSADKSWSTIYLRPYVPSVDKTEFRNFRS